MFYLCKTMSFFLVVCLVFSFGCNSSAQQVGNSDVAAIVQQAKLLIAKNDFAGAEKLLRPATEKFADQPGPWFFFGYALHAQNNYDEALKAYEKSIAFPTVKATSLYNIACIYSLTGKTDQAFEKIDEAIAAGFSNYSQLQADKDFDNIKSDPRFAKLQPARLSDDELFIEKTRIINKWGGEAAGDQFGWTARRVGDLDGDGVIDFVATAPTHKSGAGKIYVYSSKSGKLLHSVVGAEGDRLGNSAVGIGDVNADGIADFIAGAPGSQGNGAAFVYSGKDAALIHVLRGKTSAGQFGYEVSEFGDVDGDSVPDFLVGEMAGNGEADKSGKIYVYSGKTAKLIFEIGGKRSGDGFGNAAAVAQIDEGEFILAVGAQNAGESNRGEVSVFQVKDGKPELKFKIEGDDKSVNLGQMFISFPGDLNNDGTPDVYASDFSDNTVAAGGGKVVVHSGADGTELLTIHGTNAGEGLGTSPSDAGDVDGDGVGDLVIGAWQNREGAASGGKVYLYSAAGDGKLLRSWTCKESGDTLGFDACGIGDVDGDGNVDFLLTSAWSNENGLKTGRVFIVAGEDYPSIDSDDPSSN